MLFATPLAEFTATRDMLVSSFKKRKDQAAAAELQKVRKPNAVVWALNQLSKHQPKDLERLLTTDQQLGKVQEPAALRSMLAERRRIVSKLTSAAIGILKMAGTPSAAGVADRISLSLSSAGSDLHGAEMLRIGRLTKEILPGELGRMPAGEQSQSRTQDRHDLARSKRIHELIKKRDLAVAEAERLTRKSEELAKDLESVKVRAETALSHAADAQRALIEVENGTAE